MRRRSTKESATLIEVPALPPVHVVRDLLARPNPPLPILTRIVHVPVFAPDGMLQTEAGYHEATRTFYAPVAPLEVPPVADRPTPADIDQATRLLLEDLLGDFPFTTASERAHVVALILLPFVRELIEGPTPLHLIEKPAPGTGATLRANVVTLVSTGGRFAAMTEARDEDEWRKRLTSKLLTGPSVIVMDNLRRRLESAAVSSAITADTWEDRLLGRSEMVRLAVRCAWIATANNPSVSGEIARRIIRIRLDAKVDRPWLREGFRHPDLRQWAVEHRGGLVWSALTLVRAWLAAGRPLGAARLGMFEEWAAVLDGILTVVGVQGFLGNLEQFYEVSDTEGLMWRAFVNAWWEKYQDGEVGVLDLWKLACPDGGDPLDLDLGDGKERSQKTRLGIRLADMRDRQFDGKRIVRAGVFRRAQLWKLVVGV